MFCYEAKVTLRLEIPFWLIVYFTFQLGKIVLKHYEKNMHVATTYVCILGHARTITLTKSTCDIPI